MEELTAYLVIPELNSKEKLQFDEQTTIQGIKQKIIVQYPQTKNLVFHFITMGMICKENLKISDIFRDFNTKLLSIYCSILFPFSVSFLIPTNNQSPAIENHKSFLLKPTHTLDTCITLFMNYAPTQEFQFHLYSLDSNGVKKPYVSEQINQKIIDLFEPGQELLVEFFLDTTSPQQQNENKQSDTPWANDCIPGFENSQYLTNLIEIGANIEVAKVALMIDPNPQKAYDFICNGKAEKILRNSYDLTHPIKGRDIVEIRLILLRHPELAYQLLLELNDTFSQQNVFKFAKKILANMKLSDLQNIDYETIYIRAVDDGKIPAGEMNDLIDQTSFSNAQHIYEILKKISYLHHDKYVFRNISAIFAHYFPSEIYRIHGSSGSVLISQIMHLAVVNGDDPQCLADSGLHFSSEEQDFLNSIEPMKDTYNSLLSYIFEQYLKTNNKTYLDQPQNIIPIEDPTILQNIINLNHIFHFDQISTEDLREIINHQNIISELQNYRINHV